MDENACPMCGSDCNERDELTKAEREIARLRDAIIEAATKQWEDQRRTLDSVARLRTETEEFIAIFGAQFDELARLRAENERLKAGARPYTVTCEPVIDRDWPEAHSVRIRNGGQRFDIGMHLETLEEAEHYATMLRVALGIDAAMTQGKL